VPVASYMNVAKSGVSRSDSDAESGHPPFPGAFNAFEYITYVH